MFVSTDIGASSHPSRFECALGYRAAIRCLLALLFFVGTAGRIEHAQALPSDIPPCSDATCDEGRAYAETVRSMNNNRSLYCTGLNQILLGTGVKRFDPYRYSYWYHCYDVVQNYDFGQVDAALTQFFDPAKTCSSRPNQSAPPGAQSGTQQCHEGCSYTVGGSMMQPTGALCEPPDESVKPEKNNDCCNNGVGAIRTRVLDARMLRDS